MITKAALAMAAAATEMEIEPEVAVVILTDLSEEMTIAEMGPTIGAETGTEIKIGAKLTVQNVRIPQ